MRRSLVAHGGHAHDLAITATAERTGDRLRLVYEVAGELAALDWPARRVSRFADHLWRRTCFEAFIAVEEAGYREINLSPSTEWAAYAFQGYREGMQRAADVSLIAVRATEHGLAAEVALDLTGAWRLNLTAVIEATDGAKSYWALAHPAGPPDFHNPACFVLELPPPGRV